MHCGRNENHGWVLIQVLELLFEETLNEDITHRCVKVINAYVKATYINGNARVKYSELQYFSIAQYRNHTPVKRIIFTAASYLRCASSRSDSSLNCASGILSICLKIRSCNSASNFFSSGMLV